MSRNLPANSIHQISHVTRLYLLHMKIIDNLVADCLDQTMYMLTKPQLLWIKLSRATVLCRNRKLKSLKLE